MSGHIFISVLCGLGFTVAAVGAWAGLGRPGRGLWVPVNIVAGIVTLMTAGYLLSSWFRGGAFETFQNEHGSAMVLALLLALVGIGTHRSASLRGLDAFLFGFAAIVGWISIGLRPQTAGGVMQHSWFVSHVLALAIALACFAISASAGAVYLLIHRLLRQKQPSVLLGHVASLEALERCGRWSLLIGFPLFTYGLLTGVCGLAHRTMPGETLSVSEPLIAYSLAAFVLYAAMVGCVWFVPRIRGRLAAALAVAGVAAIIAGFVLVEFVAPLHR